MKNKIFLTLEVYGLGDVCRLYQYFCCYLQYYHSHYFHKIPINSHVLGLKTQLYRNIQNLLLFRI